MILKAKAASEHSYYSRAQYSRIQCIVEQVNQKVNGTT